MTPTRYLCDEEIESRRNADERHCRIGIVRRKRMIHGGDIVLDWPIRVGEMFPRLDGTAADHLVPAHGVSL